MGALNTYLTDTRYLLHDAQGSYWSDGELTSYINTARYWVVAKTGANRILQSLNTVAAQETYPFSGLPQASSTIDVLSLTVVWGGTLIELAYYPFRTFQASCRAFQNYEGRPVAWTKYGNSTAQTVYLAPIPDQVYATQWDTIVLPAALVTDADAEVLLYPFTESIAYYAAYKAKFKEQSYDEANQYLQTAKQTAAEALAGTMRGMIPNIYAPYG